MFDLFRQLPGLIVEHWFLCSIGLLALLGLGYVVVLKTYFAAEDVRDIRRRNRRR